MSLPKQEMVVAARLASKTKNALILVILDLLAALKCVLADHVRCKESGTQGGPIGDAYAAIEQAEGPLAAE